MMVSVIHMKIVKRDGRTVDYNPDKIRIAINKANDSVIDAERISKKDIDEIVEYIESLDKKRMLVEDIQDIIEEKLMEHKKYVLAKKYIIYRYKRSIIRQSNTTDASILSLLKNNSNTNGVYLVANKQRDIMAGEASKDLAYRLLLPKNVVDAEKANRIKFCNVEYFTEPIIESAKINLSDMFENGTVINGVKIESPKSFQSACNILVEILGSISFCQTGNAYVELKDLFKYYTFVYEKKYGIYKSLMKNSLTNEQIRALSETQSFLEVKAGIQTIFYQLNTLTLSNGHVPRVHFLININDITCEYEEKIVFEFIRQKISGIQDAEGNMIVPKYPAIIYAFDLESEAGKRYDYITKELLNSEVGYVGVTSDKYSEFTRDLKKFNQGSMIINMSKLALSSSNISEFMELLDRNLSYCYEGFLCRNHNLQGVYSNKSPIHWIYGGITRLDKMERIDTYLKKDHSFMALVVIGFEAASKILNMDSEAKKTIVEMIHDTLKRWNKESTFEIVLSNYFDQDVIDEMYRVDSMDVKKYGIENYFDTLDFINGAYFKTGNIYYRTEDPDEVESLIKEKRDFLIKKKASN